MINYDEACELALGYYKDNFGIEGICQPYDVGEAWVFNGGREDNPPIGIQKIAVSKDDGKITAFNLPLPKNFKLLDVATELA